MAGPPPPPGPPPLLSALPPARAEALDRQADEFVGRLPATTDLAALTDAVSAIGASDGRSLAALSSHLPAGRPGSTPPSDGLLAHRLAELRGLAEQLAQPSTTDAPRRRLFGLLPPADPLSSFIARWDQARERIARLLDDLGEEQQRLRTESAGMAQHQLALSTVVQGLRDGAYLAAAIDRRLPEGTPTELVFAVRQRSRDLLT
ncbi:MAG: hypothetical protein ABR573_10985, partial [Candidatus Dormibacteria bacterium]